MKVKVAALLTLSFVVLTDAKSEESVDLFVFDSVSSCGKWLDVRNKKGRSANDSERWLFGYASGFAVGRRIDYWANVDHASLLHGVDKHCRDNPLSTPSSAIQKLSEQTQKR